MPDYIYIKKKIKRFKKKISVSSDKSISIRSVLLASQAVGVSRISNLLESEDVMNTLRSIKKLGINYYKSQKNNLEFGAPGYSARVIPMNLMSIFDIFFEDNSCYLFLNRKIELKLFWIMYFEYCESRDLLI